MENAQTKEGQSQVIKIWTNQKRGHILCYGSILSKSYNVTQQRAAIQRVAKLQKKKLIIINNNNNKMTATTSICYHSKG